MASSWDQFLNTDDQQKSDTTQSSWDQYLNADTPKKPAPTPSRGLFGAANDYVIEAANAVLSGAKSIIDFAQPGTELAASIQRLVEEGESKQSDVARQAKQELGQALSTDDTMEQLKAVGKYAITSPGLAVSQAVGSFVAPGAAIKGFRGAAALAGVGERAAGAARAVGPLRPGVAEAASERALSRYGLAGGSVAGAALSGGDAAGNAYDMVYEGLTNAGVPEEEARAQATIAAREASVVPAAIGGLTGVFGAEAQFAGAASRAPRSILRSGLSEAGQEAFEEGATQLSANLAAGQYVGEIPAMRGVVGSAALGGVLGGITGAGVAAISRQPSSLLGNANDNLQDTNSPDADNLNQAVNKPGQMELFSTEELLANEEATRQQQAFNPYNVGGFVGAQQAGQDTTMEFTGEGVPAGTQASLLPTAGPTETVGAAQAPAPQPQAKPAKGAKQAPEVPQEQYVATAQRYGLTPVTNLNAQAWDIAGARIYGQPRVYQFVSELAAADQGKDPEQLAIESAVIAANLVQASQPTAKAVIGALNKQLEKLQISNAATVDEAAAIINDQIQRLAQAGKGAADKNVTALAQVYENLTGTEAPAYALTQGGTNVQQEQQVSTGVGEVPVQSRAGETDDGKLGLVRPGLVQPVGAGSVPQGPTGQQARQLPAEGVRPSPSVAPDTGVRGEQEAQVTEGTPDEKEAFVLKLFAAVFGKTRAKLVYDLYEQNMSLPDIAKKEGVSRSRISQIKSEYFEKQVNPGDMLNFKPQWAERLRREVAAEGMSNEDVYTFLATPEETVTEEGVATVEEGAEDTTRGLAEDTAIKTEDEVAQLEADQRETEGRIVSAEKNISQISDVGEKSQAKSKIAQARKKNDFTKLEDQYLQEGAIAALESNDMELVDLISQEIARRERVARAKGGRTTVEEETEDAVQEQGAAEVPVRKGTEGGERVGQEVRRAEKPARKTEVAVKEKTEVAPTTEEATQAAYDKLVAMLPEGTLPAYGDLTVAQKEALMSIPAEELNMRNLQRLMDESNIIDVEAREIPQQEAKLLLTQTNKLAEADVKTLEKEYGAKRGSKEFIAKLHADVTTFVNRGAQYVAENIRAIIQQVAKLAVAAAIVFNPNITGNGFNFNLQEAYAKVQTTQQEVVVPAEAASQMSDEAKIVYQQLAPLAKQQQRGFIIADKKNGKIHFFYSSGQHMISDAALYGKDVGDKFQGDSLKGGKKITPAGKFTLKATQDSEYAGGWRLDLAETSDGNGIIAVHPAWLGNTKEKRLERLASEDAKDNRISYGCINTSHDLFLNKVKPQLGEFDGGMIFVVPDAPLVTAQVQFSKRRRRERGVDAKDLKKTLGKFLGAENDRVVGIFQTIDDIPADVRKTVEKASGGPITADTQGFVYNRRAYLIADNIEPGTERAVIMHEIGSHLGLENILTEAQFDALVDKIISWSQKQDDSIESVVATKALVRVVSADPSMETRNAELVAYFIEEAILAGVNPTATATQTGFGSWFRTLWAAFKSAIRKLGINPDKLDALDVVNMAYGAARLEVAGTWHGTAATFRKFNHKFMGTGEGWQAYGWGSYLAQKAGIAYNYMLKDVSAKSASVGLSRATYEELFPEAKSKTVKDKAGITYSIDPSSVFILSSGKIPTAGIEVKVTKPNGETYSTVTLLDRFFRPEEIAYVQATLAVKSPTGKLLRVDVNAKPEELLNWDIKINDQPAIKKKLMADPRFKAILDNFDSGMGFTFNNAEDVFDSSGQYFYRGLQEAIEYGSITPENLGVDVTEEIGPDQILSTYLDSIGIKGLQFFDAESRMKTKSFYQRLIDEHEKILKNLKDNRNNKDIKAKTERAIDEFKQKLANAPEDYTATRNLVIFNDDNIFRAATFVNAEQEKVKFSKKGVERAINNLPPVARSQGQQIWDTISNFFKKALPTAAFTQDLADMAEKYVPSAKKLFDLMTAQQAKKTEYEMRIARILNNYNKLPSSVKGTGPNSVNKFLGDSTKSGKWGYKIKEESDVQLDPALEARFKAFPPEAQQVIKDVFAHGYQTLQDMKAAVRSNINTEFDALIKDAQDAGDDKEVASLQKQKDASLKQYESLLSIAGKRPYAPLKRFGNYVVVGRSQAYMDAEDAGDRARMEALQKDENHYFVQFAETYGEAKAIEREEAGRYGIVQAFEKDTAAESIYGGKDLQQVFFRLKNLAKDSFDDKTNQAAVRGINRLINDLHLSMLAESSARNAENRRRNIAGADDDMMRAFATQGRATAHFIGSLTNTGQIYETLREMKKEADARTPGRDERRRYYNEFMKRHAMGFDYNPSPVINKALATTSAWMLLTNPAYYLQNLTQPLMMSVPYMAGKHGYANANAELFKAYQEVASMVRGISLSERFDFSKLPADVRDMMETLVNRGRIDISLEQDLGDWRSAEDSKLAVLGKATNFMRSSAQKIEMINRVATAIAAYRLEKAKGYGDVAATNFADKVIRVTHGDYSGANAPRFMRSGAGRLVTQFRKFQLIQISMMARMFNDAFKGATPEERYAAKKALVWTLTHAGVAGGIMGLPGFAALAAVYGALFGDEDEPDDPELALRRAFGPELGTLMTKGLPAAMGVDVSGKIGMGQMLSILPYTDLTELNRSNYEKLVTAAMGPFIGGLVPRAVDGLGFMAQGNYYRGLEGLMPSGVSQAIKAYRLATEGVTQRNNDVTLSADEITGLDAMLVALGLPTTKLTEQQFRTRTKIKFEQFFDARTTELKRAYAKAYRENDVAGMAQARADWKQMQDARVREGFKRQPLSNLLKSPLEQRKRERKTVGGVQFDTGSRRFVASLPQ